jgi:hypothetical protein
MDAQRLDSMGHQQHYAKNCSERTNLAAHHSGAPIWAYSDELSETPLYQRILVPLDGSQRAENVLPIITQLAHFHKSQIHLVQVVQTPEMARQMPAPHEDIDLVQSCCRA